MYNKPSGGHQCSCPCHRDLRIHASARCDCGKPITPPPQQCAPEPQDCRQPPPKKVPCPPPCNPQNPDMADLPQTPPPTVHTAPQRPETVGRPPAGDPAEIPWFRGQVRNILQNGPVFGPRKDEFLPFLFVRAKAGDRGNRKIVGEFWESPDIYVAPNLNASNAPLSPPTLGGLAQAGAPNTLYAHVWNTGKAPAYRVRVEFYWFNPTLGISRSDSNFIGAAYVDLGNRYSHLNEWTVVSRPYGSYLSKGCHAIVKCPETWTAEFVNAGHECLVVRVCDPFMDAVPADVFSAATNRHVAQRNIAVAQAASPASIDLALNLGYQAEAGDAEIEITIEDPASMDWLKLYTGDPSPGLHAPQAPVVAGLLPATLPGSRVVKISDLTFECRKPLLWPVERVARGCDPLAIPVHASVANLKPYEAQVVRVRQRVQGEVVGGYSIVLIGNPTGS
jgi:hypothetical protein